jgi:hypothetical protein
MPTPEEANHQAKAEVNGKLNEINDITDELKKEETRSLPGKSGDSNQERLNNYKDDTEEKLDKIQELINTNEIVKADKAMRGLKKNFLKHVEDADKLTNLLNKLKDARRAKRKITAAPMRLKLGFNVDQVAMKPIIPTEELVLTLSEEIANLSISDLGIPPYKKQLLGKLDLNTIGEVFDCLPNGNPVEVESYN